VKRHQFIGLLLAACTWPAANASADMITYTVDPARSELTISGWYGGNPLGVQRFANSLSSSYSGTISADRDRSADTLKITGGTVAAQNNGSVTVLTDVPANYGFYVPNGQFPDVTKNDLSGNILNFAFSPTSLLITSTANFDVSQLAFGIISGEIDYVFVNPIVNPTTSISQMAGSLALASNNGAVLDTGSVETLTLPISTDLVVDINGSPLTIHLSGSIIATSDVPEPTSVVLMAASALLLLRRHQEDR